MKKALNLFVAASIVAATFVFTGCQDKDYFEEKGNGGNDSSVLEFSTTQDVKFEFNELSEDGLIMAFNVYATNPYEKNESGFWVKRTDLTPIAGGINVAGVSEVMRALPCFVTELYVEPTTPFAPALMYAKVENGVASFETFSIDNSEFVSVDSRSVEEEEVDKYLKPRLERIKINGDNYYYKPGVDKVEAFPQTVKNAIIAAFPNNEKVDDKYYIDASVEIQQEDKLDEGAELWLSVIHSDGVYANSLMYFAYTGNKKLSELNEDDKEKLHVISAFQFAKLDKKALKAGDYVQLKYFDGKKYVNRFPLNTKVGWILASDGFKAGSKKEDKLYNCTTRDASKNYPWFYSVPSWNPEKKNRNHTISFTASSQKKEYICFGFEDIHNEEKSKEGYSGDGDCNDVMFHVISNPVKAITPPPYIPEEGTVEITEKKNGILSFEDNWPRKGDYDLNDVTVKYESAITYAGNMLDGELIEAISLKRITDKMSIINYGATYNNGFSYKVGIPLEYVLSVKVDGVLYTPLSDGDGFIIDLCKNVRMETLPKSYSITIELKDNAITQDEFNNKNIYKYAKAPYNPFIIPTNPEIPAKMIEVHLPFYPPTGRADDSLFGCYEDCSNKETNIYYVASKDVYYPFALHLDGVTEFVIPIEAEPIEVTYPKYLNWVKGGCGSECEDWYLEPQK